MPFFLYDLMATTANSNPICVHHPRILFKNGTELLQIPTCLTYNTGGGGGNQAPLNIIKEEIPRKENGELRGDWETIGEINGRKSGTDDWQLRETPPPSALTPAPLQWGQ